ncbi:hypothetical protein RN001_006459 [Aquatica leii]|uniref:Uncharacterized protein n=1 Tax=Aquatica leii TaxID=1421715 RepID=A0AAN7SS92_9COLE|nr:hypothetical protein RN001_006459 [Aquatica leii]
MQHKVTFGAVWTIFLIGGVTCMRHNLSAYEQRIASGELRKACSKIGLLPQPPVRVDTTQRLKALRKILNNTAELKDPFPLDALLVTSDDDHQTEFVSNYDKRREYISGFSGRGGDAIITMDKAVLWADGQYYQQANEEINCDWLLMQEGNSLVPTQAQWLISEFPNGARIGADPRLIAADYWNSLEYELQSESEKLQLVKTKINLIDKIWLNHSETEEEKHAFTLDEHYTGKHWTQKVNETRKELRHLHAEAMVVTALDEIAWLLNIRGRDIPYTRFVKSYVLLSQSSVTLYVDLNKTKRNVTTFFNAEIPGLTDSTVEIKPYGDIWLDLKTRCQIWKSVLVPSSCVYSPGASKMIYDLVPEDKRVSKPSPIIHLKAVKNPTERIGMRNAHVRDGVAMCRFFEYFERRFKKGDFWDELKVAQEIDRFRMVQELAVDISFRTIVAFGTHGSQPHYEPSPTTTQPIFDNSTLIIDSGGQYCDGTTDVTRTIHLGEPSDEEKDAYTRVLIGSIELASLIFPDNLKTGSIDVLARAPLWEIGEDYPHGTGHGIGAFLGVHESPIYIHYNPRMKQEHFKVGYFFSNEPGIYLENKFGVRLENILEVIDKPYLKHSFGRSYLGFKDVTLVPYSNKLIKFGMLSNHHKKWLNNYNARIRNLVGTELKKQNATDAFYWMMDNTQHIPESLGSITKQSFNLVFVNVVILCYSVL